MLAKLAVLEWIGANSRRYGWVLIVDQANSGTLGKSAIAALMASAG
jgi:hypothetical protein